MKKIVLYIFLVSYALVSFIPFIWALSTSFKTFSDSVYMNLIPPHPTLDNYRFILVEADGFLRWCWNSLFTAGVTVFTNLLFNSMAGYALARLRFPGRKLWFFMVLAVLMIPAQVTMIPQYLILKSFHMLNSYQGMIAPLAVNATFIFMMRQFFINFNVELEEAAQIDGLSRIGIFFRIVLPLAKPALAAQAIFSFLGSWNNFLLPLVVVSDRSMYTLPLGLQSFQGQYVTYWNYTMAASMFSTIPALLIFIVFNRFFVRGLSFTGGK